MSDATPRPRRCRRLLFLLLALLLLPFAVPERAQIPVQGATSRDWNPQSFWYEPWGQSGVHKGIDVFAPRGREVRSSTWGIVVYRGQLGIGGKVVAVLGPKWRLHYYAHLDESSAKPLSAVAPGSRLGSVGTSGNAAGKPPHLHYAILSLLPRPWQATAATQGWKRMFFVDPGKLLAAG
ncbi:M23 family peptidase [Solimonas sp. K1W22B-7]|uniref:M23 family metallopeptidase n=1 Tax=Solimonas sp. K1W22B-7 TaxID=2303331 RepID=UPI000E336DF9|nr:M23 family metallopeptidase [Solimonas sp. K1W22B-7]AXQ29350.1 M23 family peptidase [Solimonas sp. K1W22B-7]